MADVMIKDLLEAGVHFGHQTRRWNPKMKKYIFTERSNIYIIDLQKTKTLLDKACNAVREITAKGQPILFVGTKPQAAAIMKDEAERCDQFHVTNRWLGGMLTNYRTIRQSIKKLEHLEKMATDGTYEHLTKKEILTHEKHRERLESILGGIRNMTRLPGLLIVVDTRKEKIAVREAQRLGIPICAILDTNSDPDPITYPIPGNDDAIRSIGLILSALTESIIEGSQLRVDDDAVAEKEETPQKPRRERRPDKRGSSAKGRMATSADASKSPGKPATRKAADDADDETEADGNEVNPEANDAGDDIDTSKKAD